MNEKSDRELLEYIVIKQEKAETDRCWIRKTLANHLHHHTKLEIGLLLTVLGAILTWLLSR